MASKASNSVSLPILLSWVLGLSLVVSPAMADVYKYRDRQGGIYLTDRPMSGGYTLLKVFRFGNSRSAPAVRAGASLKAMAKRRKALEPLIDRVAEENRLRPELLHAVIRAESAYRADAVSSAGAGGLMQLMPETARRYGVQDRDDPHQNVRGGASYLRDLLDQFEQNLELALAAYNAGENAVLKYGRQIPPFPETQNYVRKVIAFLNASESRQIARN